MSTTVNVARRELDVVMTADVAVCGGGPAGVAAAIAAARAGARVALLEQIGCLGGMGTAGLVPCFCPYSDGEKPVVRGIGEEVLKEMAGLRSTDIRSMTAAANHRRIDVVVWRARRIHQKYWQSLAPSTIEGPAAPSIRDRIGEGISRLVAYFRS